jgi:uncharacterized protein (TIGR02270 family)
VSGRASDPRPRAPLAEAAPGLQATLDRVLLSLRRLPAAVDRAPIAGPIQRAQEALSRFAAMRPDHPDAISALDEAAAHVATALERLRALGDDPAPARAARALAGVATALAAGQDAAVQALVAARMLRAPAPQPPAPPAPFLASQGVPRLHRLDRPPLVPAVDLSPSEPAPLDDDDDDDDDDDGDEAGGAGEAALPPEGAAAAREAAPAGGLTPEELGHLRAMARDCLEDIAALGTLRRPLHDRPWTAAQRFERRLLENLDALLALAWPGGGGWDLLDEVQRHAGESLVPDAGRAFARAFVLGAVEGADTVRAAVLALRQAHPFTRAAYGDALSLAPSPAIGPAMRELLRDGDPVLARLALEVLDARGEATFGAVVPLVRHADAAVAAAAARCLGRLPQRAAAAEVLEELLDVDADDALTAAAAESLLRLGEPTGLHFARRKLEAHLVDRRLPDAAHLAHLRLTALAGDPRDVDLLARVAGVTPAAIRRIGWAGHPALVDRLLAVLEAANEVRRATGPWPLAPELAASEALHRITGATLRDDPESGIEHASEDALAIEAPAWRRWWTEARPRFAGDRRYRLGRPLTPAAILDELEADSLPGDRRDGELELAIMTQGAASLRVDDWVARQRERLAVLRRG